MKPTKSQRDWVKRTIEKWRPRLFLGEWYISVDYMKEDCPENTGITADTNSDPDYIQTNIRIYPEFFKTDLKRREHHLVHELCHCITQEAAWMIIDLQRGKLHSDHHRVTCIERLTQRITNIAFRDEW